MGVDETIAPGTDVADVVDVLDDELEHEARSPAPRLTLRANTAIRRAREVTDIMA
jgi:hypothetical protein